MAKIVKLLKPMIVIKKTNGFLKGAGSFLKQQLNFRNTKDLPNEQNHLSYEITNEAMFDLYEMLLIYYDGHFYLFCED